MVTDSDQEYKAQRIEGWRLIRDWPKHLLADATGLLREKISYVENGQRLLKATDLVKIARALQVSAGEFLPPVETNL